MAFQLLLLVASLVNASQACFQLSSIFSDGMVLQAAPHQAHIYGITEHFDGPAIEGSVTCEDFQRDFFPVKTVRVGHGVEVEMQ